ncbi:ABC transporter substrate-binding protein [Rhodoferax sp.]|uniref:ABC transporter substrate-binding protein n=1 Tax=Rhodoferax sp. TaxID=50421 RepID=UPI00283D2D5D|nr:ABC transporter substrate-binding protein [Rhodoferax sp.]MDR3369630.1 ABC transporter substrate-binding protein [Rhodoferax sp.]
MTPMLLRLLKNSVALLFLAMVAGMPFPADLITGASHAGLISVAFGAQPTTPIVIAHVAPTTGRFSLHSEADRRGVEMAIDEFNARGGVLGREIVLISRDPTLDPGNAATVANELITKTRIGFMVGAISSGVAASMSAVCQKYGVIFINTNSSAPSEAVENAHRTKFVFDANAANYNRTLLKYALSSHTSKRVVLLTEDDEWGRSSAAASNPYIAEYGGAVVGEVMAPETLPDPTGIIKQVSALKPDVVAVNISGDNQIKLFAQVAPEMLKKQSWVVGEVDWEDLYPAPGTPRPLFGMTWAWTLKTPGTAEFVARYRKRYGHTRLDFPGHVTHAAYLATKALLNAIERVGTTDNHAVIEELERYKASAAERMQDSAAFMDPISHHLQQSTYIATWHPRSDHPELGLEILGQLSPDQVRYTKERSTRLESLADTPHYAP